MGKTRSPNGCVDEGPRRNNINQKHTMAKWFLIKRAIMKNGFLVRKVIFY